ncbi:MAG: MATE family efflux transporter [Oscillospiraceae bacterium]|nr:MATE family efflux transporter [Oscillospiraceae bacterium]
MMAAKRMDLTTGKPVKQILLFSIPLVLGSLFQQMYSFVDTIMVGRLISSDALAAVGSVSSLNFLVIGFVGGTCSGFTIPLAKSIGAGNTDDFQKYLWNGFWICAILAMIMTVLTNMLTYPLLHLINTPTDILENSAQYIRILFCGIPVTILYNFSSGILRASGDSQRPTNHLLVSSCVNIVLDFICIVPLGLGVSGAALATVSSQLLSGLLNIRWIVHKTELLKNSSQNCSLSRYHLSQLCKMGFPMGFDTCIVGLGSVAMQSAINTLGTAAVTGQVAGEKIRQIFTIPMSSVGAGMATFAGQNDGAKRYDRLSEGLKGAISLQMCYSLLACLVINLGKESFVSLILGPDSGQPGIFAGQYLTVMSCLFWVNGTMFALRNTLTGMGYSAYSVFSGICELIGKALGGLLAVKWFGFWGICIATPLAWFLAMVYCGILVRHFLKKRLASLKS